MTEPPFYLQPILQSIESVAVAAKEEEPRLDDKDVEWVYGKMKDYYKQVRQGKTPNEPTSTIERKDNLIEGILTILDFREKQKTDIEFINNPEFTNNAAPIPNLAALYYNAFNRLEKSARFWRKNREYGGYLGYISNFL